VRGLLVDFGEGRIKVGEMDERGNGITSYLENKLHSTYQVVIDAKRHGMKTLDGVIVWSENYLKIA